MVSDATRSVVDDDRRTDDQQRPAPVVSITDATKKFERHDKTTVVAVDHLSLDVGTSEMVVLLGPSGCGKTTLLRCVAGLEDPDSGSIAIGGHVVSSPKRRSSVPPENREIGMMFQTYALWPHMSVWHNVSYPLRVRGFGKTETKEKTTKVLELVGITHLRDEYPGRLSGGQQQRVGLARSLVAEPRVVLFDEPLSNVDAKVREELRLEIVTMQKQLGFGALYVTHDQEEAMQIADRLVVLESGGIAAQGAPDQVYKRPSSRYVADFIGASNQFSGTVVDRAEDGSVDVDTEIGELRAAGASFSTGDAVVAVLRPHHVTITPTPSGNEDCHGEVVARMFMGAYVQYVVDVGQQLFRVWAEENEDFYDGAKVGLRVPSDRVTLVPDDLPANDRDTPTTEPSDRSYG